MFPIAANRSDEENTTPYVDDVFSTYLYTGNGSTQTITNGIDLAGKGGLVWTKCRGAAVTGSLEDTTRGIPKRLVPSNTNAEVANGDITSYTSTGYTLGFIGGSDNVDGYGMVSWTFRKSPKFFDVQTVTHTNGTANNINLSVLGTVGMVIAKITTTTGDWIVWHRSLTTGTNLTLNTVANASTTNAWLSVSGTTATLAATAPTGTYVIYAYAHDTSSTGIIQCGSFSGNYGAFTTVNLGWQPQYVFWKAVDNDGSNGNILDTMRAWTNNGDTGSDSTLKTNNGDAESAAESLGEPNVSGFRIKCQNSAGSAGSYIYMAIRMPNKPPTSGTQVYAPIARTGTGAAATVTGVGFAPDLVIGECRSQANGSVFKDRLRGVSPYNYSFSGDKEYSENTAITSFNMDGISVGTDSVTGCFNLSSQTYVNQFFKRAPGFFDEVCYTGTAIVTTQAHNLTVVPELMIIKERPLDNFNWAVYASPIGNTKYLTLNTDGASQTDTGIWNSTTPTASVFTINSNVLVNSSTRTYFAYLFATLAGISKVGSYTGNGTSQNIECGFAAGARFVLIKRTDSTGNWYTWDTARGIVTGNDPHLSLNSTAAEVTTNDSIDPYSPGFTVNQVAATNINVTSATYIFLAIA